MAETPLFSIRALCKQFPAPPGEAPYQALSDIDLDIYEGQCLLIAGSNGSGKTALMRIIAGLLAADGGELRFRGRPLAEAKRQLRRELGLVFQDADSQIVGETVAEDVGFGPENLGLSSEEVRDRVDRALDAMALASRRDCPPRRLSGGEKRRLAVAGILAMGGTTVIMDEPFANLDWPGVVQTLRVIADLKQNGKTVIILTHELEKVLALADRLVILHGGRIRDDGTPAELLERLDAAWGVRDPRKHYAAAEDCTWLER